MAALAIRSLLPLVHVFVTRSAITAEAEEGVVEVLHLDLRASGGWN